MAVLKSKDIEKMNIKDIESKIKELRMELVKTKLGNKKSSKLAPKEVKKAIARLLTFKNLNKNKKVKENKDKEVSE